jgi:hypothetical protein
MTLSFNVAELVGQLIKMRLFYCRSFLVERSGLVTFEPTTSSVPQLSQDYSLPPFKEAVERESRSISAAP